MMKDNLIATKSKSFAIRIVNLYKYLHDIKRESVMSRQILKSGTRVGANVRESRNAQSVPDFISKLSIALKEADETAYWLELLHETDFIDETQYESLIKDVEEIIKLLISILKTTKNRNGI